MTYIETLSTVTEKEIKAQFTKLAKAEKITKEVLANLSRVLLAHSIQNKTPVLVNQLIGSGILTATNAKFAKLYFDSFMPFSIDDDDQYKSFSTKKFNSDKSHGMESIEAWLSVETNDIWSWVADNVKIEQKPVDYLAKLGKDITKALESGATKTEIIMRVLDSGITLDEFLQATQKAA